MNQPVKIENLEVKKSNQKQWLSAIIAIIFFILVVSLFNGTPSDIIKVDQEKLTPPLVSVFKVSPSSYRAKIEVLGEVKPRWQTELRAFVRGEVLSLTSSLLEGRQVKRGQLLLTIDNTRYLAQLGEAQNRLASAKVSLLMAERESKQAERNWQLSGLKGEPESPLAFHQPQLVAAKFELSAAESAVKDAERDLSYTSVSAPFDGTIIARSVNPGETLEVGQPMLTIISNQLLDIPIKLNHTQWQLIGAGWQGQAAELHNINNHQVLEKPITWPATLDRASGFIDPATRQRTLFLKTTETEKLLPGSMVKATITGREFQYLLKVPQGAITRDGYVWLIDQEQLLQRWRAIIHFSEEDWSFISLPKIAAISDAENIKFWQLVVTPLASYLPGSKAQPEIIE